MLIHDWRAVLGRAWSIRLMLLAGLLSGFEVMLPLAKAAGWLEWMPAGPFAVLSFMAVAAAFVTRILAQKNL